MPALPTAVDEARRSLSLHRSGVQGLRARLAELSPVRAVAFLAALGLAGFVMLYRLGTTTWQMDELIYRSAGWEYVHGNLKANQEHPFLAKYLFGMSQLLFGTARAGATRLPSALAGLAIGIVLFLFARRVADFWTGLLAFALWTLLPHGLVDGIGSDLIKIERLAYLEAVMVLFMILAVYLGWRWGETGRWQWALTAGAAAGLATGSKATAILVLPGVVVGALWLRRFSVQSLAQAAAALATCALTALATYAPLGGKASDAIRYMFRLQTKHGAGGHTVFVAGRLYPHPPWWAHLWWQWLNYHTPPRSRSPSPCSRASCCARADSSCTCSRPSPSRSRTFRSSAASSWRTTTSPGRRRCSCWSPWSSASSSPWVGGAASRRSRSSPRWRGSRVTTVARVATLEPTDYPVAAQILRDHHATGADVLVLGYPTVAGYYLAGSGTHLVDSLAKVHGTLTAVIDDPTMTRRYSGNGLLAYRSLLDDIRPLSTRYRAGRLDVYVLNHSP